MTSRIKVFLLDIINQAQTTFVGERRIGDNSLLSQEVFHNYHRKLEQRKYYAIKINIMKAHGSMRWDFLIRVLETLKFPSKMVKGMEVCISSSKCSISANGELVGFFGCSKGLRQRDLISSHFFVMAVEVLCDLLEKAVMNPSFKFYKMCKELKSITFALLIPLSCLVRWMSNLLCF